MLKNIRAARPDGVPIYVILDSLFLFTRHRWDGRPMEPAAKAQAGLVSVSQAA